MNNFEKQKYIFSIMIFIMLTLLIFIPNNEKMSKFSQPNQTTEKIETSQEQVTESLETQQEQQMQSSVNSKEIEQNTCFVEATIKEITEEVELEKTYDSIRRHIYEYPTVEYEYDGKTYTDKFNVGRIKGDYNIGDKINILIYKDNPAQIYYPPEESKIYVTEETLQIMDVIVAFFIGTLLFNAFMIKIDEMEKNPNK